MFHRRIDDQTELRLLEEKDAEELYALVDANRDFLREWLPWVDATRSVQHTRAFIREAMKQFSDTMGFHAAILRGGSIAGVIGFHRIDWANRKVMIGYWQAPRHQGRGIMTMACREMIRHAVEEFKLNRVEIHCAVGNRKSQAIPERLGFAREGIIRQGEYLNGVYVDLVGFSLLAEDWAARAEAEEA